MCNDNFFHGGVVFPNFTRYACCSPCCDGSVSAERVESDQDDNRCCGCCHCCCCCRHCCCDNDNDVGSVSDNNFRCPCRSGW